MSSQETIRGRAGVPRWLAVVSVVVLVAGLVAFGFFGWRYLQAREVQQVADQRETITETASQVIINAFSFDHRDVDSSLEQLAAASTGDFLAEQEQWGQDVKKRVTEQKAVTTATVSHSAVNAMDLDAGTASVLVVFTAHSEREGEEPITGRQAMRVDLTREDDEWKANAVNQVGVTVPVGESSASVQQLPDPTDAGGGDTGGGDESDAPADGEAGAGGQSGEGSGSDAGTGDDDEAGGGGAGAGADGSAPDDSSGGN